MNDDTDYVPHPIMRSAMVQTALASSKFRLAYCGRFEGRAERIVLDAGPGLKTTAYVNRHPNPKGMIVLLHGWLGQPQSTYVLSAAKTLFDHGFSTARITLPEHAEAALMNPEFVPVTRHGFLHAAMEDLCLRDPAAPLGLVGFSLGGNFALRIARDLKIAPLPQLKQVVAISPAIDPEASGTIIDAKPIIRRYFMRKLKRLCRQKLDLYPELEYLSHVLNEKTAMGVTRAFVSNLPEFASLDAYFEAYRIKENDFEDSIVNVTILASDDDPIVSSDAAHALSDGPRFEKIFTRYGGHNGFFEKFPSHVMSEQICVDRFNQAFCD